METGSDRICNLDTSTSQGTIFQIADGSIQGCNQNVEKMLGYSIQQLQKIAYFDPPWRTIDRAGANFPPDRHPAIITLKTGEPQFDVVMGFYKADGELIWLLLNSQPLFQANSSSPYGAITTIEEIAQETEPLESRAALRESREQLKLATAVSGIGIWFWDLKTNVVEWTEQGKALFGLSKNAELTYEMFFDLVHLEDRNRVHTAVRDALDSKTQYSVEYRIIRADNSVRWLLARGRGFYNSEGEPVRMMGTIQDISQRRQAEAELVKTNSILESIISDASSIVFVKDLEGHYVIVNQSAANFIGTEIEQILGKSDRDLLDAQTANLITAIDRQVIEQGIAISYEEKISNGTQTRFLLTNKYPWRDRKGNTLGTIGICRDRTLLKQSQQKLEEKEKLLSLALSCANAGSWNWEIKTDRIFWSPENYVLYGLDPQQGSPQYQDWEDRVHPEDRDKANLEVQQVLSGQLPRFNSEFRIIHPEKGIRWLWGLGDVTYDETGEPVRLSGINLDISDLKHTEEQLRRSEQHVRRILDSLYIFVSVMTPDGILLEVNRAALDVANLKSEDVIGKPFAQTYWWSYDSKIQAQLNDAIVRAAAGEVVRFDTLGRGDGENQITTVDFSIIPVFDEAGRVEYLVSSAVDISDREASKQALKQREQELKLITEVIPQQVWTTLPNGEIDYINRRWQEYTGMSLAEVQQKGWSIIVHPDDVAQVEEKWDKAIELGIQFNAKGRLRGKDGVYRWFLGRAVPLYGDRGEIVKWYGTNTSINRIKELEDELRQQTIDLINANQLKDEFLAIVSHELRTPLNPILGWSQLLSGGRLDAEKTAKGIEIIERNAKLQTQLIDDLLDVSRILRGKLNLKQTPLNLESVIRSALTTVQLAANTKKIQIETKFEPDVGRVFGDAARLQQIVWNLVSNAIKFTPEEGRVTVELARVENRAQIQIIDTGRGIEPEFLPYVFERFRQAQSSSTREFGGLGLGLAIVRHLTELHGGTVSVNSLGVGRGASFTVRLPLMNTAQTPQDNLDDEDKDRSVEGNRFSQLQILVVDDEPDSLNILTMVLEQQGATVTPVTSAKLALKSLQELTPDLIISDIGMPEVDGYTLMTQIRKLPQGTNILAIALTAYAGEMDRQRSSNAGFQHHLAKPINIPELINVITRLIK